MEVNFLEVNSAKIVEEVLNQIEARLDEPLFPGDERRIFGEALAMVINAQYQTINDGCRQRLLRYARGEVLDALGENRGVTRIQPSPAETVVQFSVEEPLSKNVIIPAGIRMNCQENLFFKTSRTVVLQAGQKNVNVEAESVEGGSQYNGIEIGKINTIVDKSEIPLIDAVTNLVETFGGGNIEDDATFRERIRTAENAVSCGTESSYRYWTVSSNSRVVDAAISTGIEHVTITKKPKDGKVYLCAPGLIENTLESETDFTVDSIEADGLVTLSVASAVTSIDLEYQKKRDGVVTVMPIMAGGEVPDEDVLEDVRAVLTREDVKPLTDYVEVLAPKRIPYDIEVEYVTTVLDEAACVQTIESTGGAIDDYIYWQDSSTDHDINPDQLAKRILCPHSGTGATRVKVIKPEYTSLKNTEIPKWSGKLTVSHTVRK